VDPVLVPIRVAGSVMTDISSSFCGVNDLPGPRRHVRRGPVVISDGWAWCDQASRGPS
jgi:hypothetical protein